MTTRSDLIHEVQVTKENVSDMLHTELFRLMHRYGPRMRDYLAALVVGPNAFKAWEEWSVESATFSRAFDKNGPTFQGIPLLVGPLPFVVPMFKEEGWYYAHQEAKRMNDCVGGLDS